MGQRRRARENALQMLYMIDAQSERGDVAVDAALADFWTAAEGTAAAARSVRDYADLLARGVIEHRADLDARIEATSHHWRVDRMACVDRNVLRLAAYELVHRLDVPRRAVLNEAIDLAKQYGSEDSGAFVNGILDRLEVPERQGET
jgi:N utilization substance protein B